MKVDAWELNSEMGIEIETPSRLADDYWDSPNSPLAIRDNPVGPLGFEILSQKSPAARNYSFRPTSLKWQRLSPSCHVQASYKHGTRVFDYHMLPSLS